jgi:ribonuclease Z
MAVVEEATWAPPSAIPTGPPKMADRDQFAADNDIPADAMQYSDFIAGGVWSGVDDALRGVYKEASQALGQEFVYPKDK